MELTSILLDLFQRLKLVDLFLGLENIQKLLDHFHLLDNIQKLVDFFLGLENLVLKKFLKVNHKFILKFYGIQSGWLV